MKLIEYLSRMIAVIALLFAVSLSATAQTYNSNSGGYNTGYGTVYGSFGLAAASQNMYNTIQMNMQRAMLQSTLKKSGTGSTASGPQNSSSKGAPRSIVKNYGKFVPDATVDSGKMLSDVLATNAEEKALLKQIYTAIKAGYDKEAAAKGWKNNLAGALTFFIVSSATVYHDGAEPNDATVAALYDAVNQTIDEIPEFGKMTNRNKQAFNNMLIGFAAIPLATYSEGKGNSDAATLKAARDLAGQLLEMVLNIPPDRVRFENGEMKFAN